MKDPNVCDSCLCWLDVCKAECCKQFKIVLTNFQDFKKGSVELVIRKPFVKDMVKYYELHGCSYDRKTLRLKIPLEDYEFVGDSITVFRTCDYLTKDLLCSAHGTSRQPVVCQNPSLACHKDLKGVVITANCLFKHKK